MSDGWDGILDDNETILWQGQPDGALQVDFLEPKKLAIAVLLGSFFLVWMWGAVQAGGFFWIIGLLFFGKGLFKSVGIHFWTAYVRQNTYYTLTSKRAFIATDLLGQKGLNSYPIKNDTLLEFQDGDTQNILFATASMPRKNGNPQATAIGFEKILDGRAVYDLMLGLQQDQP